MPDLEQLRYPIGRFARLAAPLDADARRAHIDTIVFPKLNKKDLDEVPVHLRRGMSFHMVDNVEEVLALALIPPQAPKVPAGAKTPPRPFPGRPRKPITV